MIWPANGTASHKSASTPARAPMLRSSSIAGVLPWNRCCSLCCAIWGAAGCSAPAAWSLATLECATGRPACLLQQWLGWQRVDKHDDPLCVCMTASSAVSARKCFPSHCRARLYRAPQYQQLRHLASSCLARCLRQIPKRAFRRCMAAIHFLLTIKSPSAAFICWATGVDQTATYVATALLQNTSAIGMQTQHAASGVVSLRHECIHRRVMHFWTPATATLLWRAAPLVAAQGPPAPGRFSGAYPGSDPARA